MIRTEYAVFTDAGGRTTNEDSVIVRTAQRGLLLAVADGVGSRGSGEIASNAALSAIGQCFEEGLCKTRAGIAQAIGCSNEAVCACQTPDCQMMTTLAALFVENENAVWAHAGDTRVYHFVNAKLLSRTADHSVPQMAVDMGMITEEEIRFHPDRSRILRALGDADGCEGELAPPVSLSEDFHAFLLCTDGFWEYILENEMEELLTAAPNSANWLQAMVDLTKSRAPEDRDNYTAAALFVMKDDTDVCAYQRERK